MLVDAAMYGGSAAWAIGVLLFASIPLYREWGGLAVWAYAAGAVGAVALWIARMGTRARVLGVFAFVRLLSALPITPGGLGIVDLGYIGGLVLAGRHQTDVPAAVFQAQVAAAVLVFRALTYGLQLPHGALAYFIWQRRKSWRKASPRGSPV